MYHQVPCVTEQQISPLSKHVLVCVQIEINLTPWMPDAAASLPSAPQDLAATDRPALWGWRLTQLWTTQPWLRAIQSYEIGLLTVATAFEAAGKEMLVSPCFLLLAYLRVSVDADAALKMFSKLRLQCDA